MFQSFLAVPLHFTVEFLGFLVCAGGAFLVVSRNTLVPGPPSNRLTAALGLGALAAAQVLHGGSFIPLDSDSVLIGIYAVGFAFLAVALSGAIGPKKTGPPPAAAAFLGLPLKEPLAFASAGAALFLAMVAGAGASRGGGRALWRLSAAGVLLSASQVFLAMAPRVEFGAGEVETYANLAHGAKALGFLALGSWLWTGVRSSIRVRFVASFAGLLLVVVLVLSSALTGVISNSVEEEELDSTSAQLQGIVDSYRDNDIAELADTAVVVAGDDEVLAAFQGKKPDVNTLSDKANEFAIDNNPRDLSFVVFFDPEGKTVSSGGRGPAQGEREPPLTNDLLFRLSGLGVVQEVIERGTDASSNPDRVGDIVVLAAAARIERPGGNTPLGIALVGRFIDQTEMDRLELGTRPATPSLIVEGKVRASNLPEAVLKRFRVPRLAVTDVRLGESVALNQSIGTRSYFNAFAPLLDQEENPIDDTILMLSSPARIVAATRGEVTRILFLVAMGIGVVVLLLAWLSGRRITRPIQSLTAAAGAVREGDLTARAKVAGEDEVGQLGETFNEMTAALLRNTNDLRTAAEEEQRLRARIETIIQSMADGLVAVGPDHKILAFNLRAEELTGIKSSKAIGKPIADVIQARDSQGTSFPLPIYDLAEGSVDGVFLARKSGDAVPVAVDSAVLRAPDGTPAGGVAVFRDMTREREVERMKSEFLSNISHELRTPLTPIKGYAQILGGKEVPPEKTKQFAVGILESTARLERIVELLVDFSALEAGRLAPRTKPVDVGEIIESLAQELRKRSSRHEVVVDVKAKLPKVLGDERLLRKSLEEVLDNAVKFSPDGGTIRLEVRGHSATNGQRRRVEVAISDEGIGIAPEDMSKIFSDFQQLDGSETRTYGGLGLGLAFVRRIVEAHDGWIEVHSEPDQGTRLSIIIPAARRGTGG